MVNNRLPQGIRKFIRLEKARIRRTVLDVKEQDKTIKGFCAKFFVKTK
jgi:hypothetical protein